MYAEIKARKSSTRRKTVISGAIGQFPGQQIFLERPNYAGDYIRAKRTGHAHSPHGALMMPDEEDLSNGEQVNELASFSGRVLLVEDEDFTRTLVADGLNLLGVQTVPVNSSAAAIEALKTFDPNVVICDLDLGAGPSGAALLERLAEEQPWLGLIALTAHASPELAIHDGRSLPESAIYVVKSQLNSIADLLPLAAASIENLTAPISETRGEQIMINRSQGDILRLMAEGYSNAGIAEERGVSVHAAESQVKRLFQALGLAKDNKLNQRVLAVRLWQQGKVFVQ
jgi:DNA-binding NarL/FixJ family response regulator